MWRHGKGRMRKTYVMTKHDGDRGRGRSKQERLEETEELKKEAFTSPLFSSEMDTTAPRSTCCGYSSLLARVAGDREEA
jgi:hypothetical protein